MEFHLQWRHVLNKTDSSGIIQQIKEREAKLK